VPVASLRGSRQRALCFAILAIVFAILPGAAVAQGPDVPDPVDRGDYTPASVDQLRLGTVQLQEPLSSGGPATAGTAAAPIDLQIRGSLYYPSDRAEASPLILLVHGNHASCDSGTNNATATCTVYKRNDQGYAYLAENLASWGYTVFSLDQDQLMLRQDGSKGKGMHQRRLYIAAALDKLYAANEAALPDDANTNVGGTLVGKLDMTRIGLMGHSRGGDAVTSFIDYNRMRDDGRRYPIRGVISLAPVDYERKAPYGTPYLSILPFCDGDVSNLQGARFYERSQYIKGDDPFPRIQMSILGTNHNWFNTVWFADGDDSTTADSACSSPNNSTAGSRMSGDASGDNVPANNSYVINNADKANPAVNTRISGDPARMGDQEKAGLATMSAFFRRYVGGEGALDPYMTGELSLTDDHEQLPESACPTSVSGVRMDCAERLSTSYFAAPAERLDVLRPEADDPVGTSALGTRIAASGFANPYTDDGGVLPKPATTESGLDWCNPEPTHFAPDQLGIAGNPEAKRACPLPAPAALGGQNGVRERAPVNHSYGRQLAIAWDNPRGVEGTGEPATIATRIPKADGDVSGLKALAMGADVNFFDPRNPARTGTDAEFNPALTTQDFAIAVIDSEGNEAVVSAADPRYGNALHQTTGSITSRVHIVLDQIRVPLSDFAADGVDLTALRRIELRFGEAGMPQTGSIQLADVRFQEADAEPEVLVDSMEPDAGASIGPVPSGPDPAVELAEYDSTQGNQELPDVVGVGDSAASWTVDDDGEQCPNASFSSIQDAVDQAAPWDTIVVCAGLYQESSAPVYHQSNPVTTGAMNGLTITKPLKIKGAGAEKVTIEPDPELGPTLAGANPYLRDGGGNVITVSRQSLGSTDDNEQFVDISGVTVRSPDVWAEAGIAYFNASGRISSSVVGPVRAPVDAIELAENPHGWGVVMTNSLVGSGEGTVERQLTVDGTRVSDYGAGGILIDGAKGTDASPDTVVRQGIQQFGFITDSVITGSRSTLFPQTGIKYASGTRGFVRRNRITANYYRAAQRLSAGVLLTDAATEIAGAEGFQGLTGNIISGNGYGVFNANADNTAVRLGAPVTATGNYWRSSLASGAAANTPVEGPSQPDNGIEGVSENDANAADSVIATSPLTAAPALPTDYTPAGDAAPTGAIVDPGDADEFEADEVISPVVRAVDDYGISSVSLSAGEELVGTLTEGPYEFEWTPGSALAGTTVTLTATITDSSGQTATDTIEVAVAEEDVVPPPDPDPDPDPPAESDPTLELGPVSKDKSKGTAVLGARVSDPGTIELRGPGIRKRELESTGGLVDLLVKPKAGLRRDLKEQKRLTVTVEVLYTPDSGPAVAKERKIHLVMKR